MLNAWISFLLSVNAFGIFIFRIILVCVLFSERSQCVTTELQQSGDKSMN